MMTDQVFARAAVLAGELEAREMDLLRILCSASAASLTARLKEGLSPEDCGDAFVTAASLYALADLGAVAEKVQVEEFKAGDLTVKQGSTRSREAAADCLQKQAEALIGPYLKDRFAFLGV